MGAVPFLATDIAAVAGLPLIRHFRAGGAGYEIMNVARGAGGLAGALIAARIVSKDNQTAAAVPGVLAPGIFAAAGATTTFASAAGYGFAGSLVTAAGWRLVYLAGGLVGIACAAIPARALRTRASRPAQHPPPARPQHGQAARPRRAPLRQPAD